MHSRPTHLVLLLVSALLVCSSWSHVIEGRRSNILEARGPKKRSLCSPKNDPEFAAATIGVELNMVLPSDPPYSGDIDRFMNTRTKSVFNLVTNVPGGDEMSSGKHAVLPPSNVLHRAVRTMCGCSSLIIFSEKAVFFTHYWENLAFEQGPGEPPADLKREVLDPLERGRGQVHDSLKDNADKYKNQPGLVAFLMTPKAELGNGVLYPAQVVQIINKVNELIGIKPTTVMYDPLDSSDAKLGTDARGTALFQFDPKHFKDGQRALAKIWIERSDKLDYRWDGPGASSIIKPPPTVGLEPPMIPGKPPSYPPPTVGLEPPMITGGLPSRPPPPPPNNVIPPFDQPGLYDCHDLPKGGPQDVPEQGVKYFVSNLCKERISQGNREGTIHRPIPAPVVA
ncbi:MAG: hypothetical protein M1823_004090 [Watsoniomyces obsoletus]|nr:MAG: hypothetical protein M1823_004090 [Watsoniomyces obsoletus]